MYFFRSFYTLLLLITSWFSANNLFAQEKRSLDGFGVEVNTLAGKIIKHSSKFTSPIPALSTAKDINFLWQTYGRKEWQQRRNFPVVGVGITYTDYGNNRVFGRCVSIYGSIQMSLIKRGNFEWTLRLGNGLAYVTRKHTDLDTSNSAIGSHFNDFAIIMSDLRYRFDDHWSMQAGANFTHISNGNYHQPNLGVNFAGGAYRATVFPGNQQAKKDSKGTAQTPEPLPGRIPV